MKKRENDYQKKKPEWFCDQNVETRGTHGIHINERFPSYVDRMFTSLMPNR